MKHFREKDLKQKTVNIGNDVFSICFQRVSSWQKGRLEYDTNSF